MIKKKSLEDLGLEENKMCNNKRFRSGNKEPDKLMRKELLYIKTSLKDDFILADFSKTHPTNEFIDQINDVLLKKGFLEEIQRMFSGEKINFTENRSVMHTALRDEQVIKQICQESATENGFDGIKKDVYDELQKINLFCKDLHQGMLKGVTGKTLNRIVNIGIGGSDLGPRIVCEALYKYRFDAVNTFFVSNVDPSEMMYVLSKIDPEETLFVVVSKTFTTQETIANANLAIEYISNKISVGRPELIHKHFIAVSSDNEEVSRFGISKIFKMWDFVGGRYSLWSAAGISIALYIGFDNFIKLISGASMMDKHFQSKGLKSLPAVHAVIEIYYSKIGYDTKCIVPYDFYLRNFYLHIQQLEMESNGKSATRTGASADKTGMIIWGGVGTNSQHSFFQLLHQGTHRTLVEFLMPLSSRENPILNGHSHHEITIANCIAQGEALMKGRDSKDINKRFVGGRPSICISYSRLTPEILGALIASYEHKVFLQGFYWGINSFDQFGVELGKEIAKDILKSIETSGDTSKYSYSTQMIIGILRDMKSKDDAKK